MQLGDLAQPLATFGLALLLVVGATAGTAIVAGELTDTSTQPDVESFQPDSLLPTPVADEGAVGAPDAATPKTVVVDVSHGNDVSRADMQPLVNSLVGAGHEVQFFSGGSSNFGPPAGAESPLSTELQEADALVIANPATAYSDDEVDSIEAFTTGGGKLLLLADTPTRASSSTPALPGLPTTGSTAAASGQPTNVAGRFGITFGSGYLYDMTDNANNFQYVYGDPAGSDELSAEADRTVFREAVPLVTRDAATTVVESSDARLSSTRENGTFAVAARSGNVVAVGDTWFLSPDAATLADNEQLVGDIASFLVADQGGAGLAPASGGGAALSDGTVDPSPTPPANGTNTTA